MTIRKKIYIALFVLVAFVLLIIVFVVYPLLKDIESNAKELVSQKEKMASLEAKSSNLKGLKATYNEFQGNLEKIDGLFVDAKVPVEFISFLENTAKESNVKAKILSAASRQGKGDAWPSLGFQIESSSSFSDFLKFLEKLESAPYLIKVIDLHIVRDGVSLNQVKTIFSLKVYTK